MGAKLCDSCRTTWATLFCRADSAFLCIACDGKVHAANKLASLHARVWMCDVCEQAAASVTCKADAAALCVTCDRDIHSANPLARRHERIPVVPFFDPADQDRCFSDEEAEAASWLLPNPNLNKIPEDEDEDDNDNLKVLTHQSESEYLFSHIDPYLDTDQKPHQRYGSTTDPDGVVPVQNSKHNHCYQIPQTHAVVDGVPTYDIDYDLSSKPPFMYNFTSQSISQSVSSSSMEIEVGVVPEDSPGMGDVSNNRSLGEAYPSPVSGLDREARVLRYREKRKNRKFEKTIRYASRKAYAETRPRIKGRFAKRSEIDDDAPITLVPSYY